MSSINQNQKILNRIIKDDDFHKIWEKVYLKQLDLKSAIIETCKMFKSSPK